LELVRGERHNFLASGCAASISLLVTIAAPSEILQPNTGDQPLRSQLVGWLSVDDFLQSARVIVKLARGNITPGQIL
jgi:hypothetical protein